MTADSIEKITHAEILGIISAWFIMIGSFLPWVVTDAGYLSDRVVLGFDLIGGFTLLFGTICFLLFYFGNKYYGKYKTFLGVLLLGILIFFLVINESIDGGIHDKLGYYSYYEMDYHIEYGIGYYLTFFGSIGLLISAAWLFIDTYKSETK